MKGRLQRFQFLYRCPIDFYNRKQHHSPGVGNAPVIAIDTISIWNQWLMFGTIGPLLGVRGRSATMDTEDRRKNFSFHACYSYWKLPLSRRPFYILFCRGIINASLLHTCYRPKDERSKNDKLRFIGRKMCLVIARLVTPLWGDEAANLPQTRKKAHKSLLLVSVSPRVGTDMQRF